MLKPTEFEKLLIAEYLKHGSINKVFYTHHFNLPISYAGYDRLLNRYRIIKSAGPNSKLTESLNILRLVADYKLSLEKIYEKHAPKKMWVSSNTLHRILHYTRLGLTRRQGVALIIQNPQGEYLVGNDLTLTNNTLGLTGDLSLPMSHSKLNENPVESIARVLQQEVFVNHTISNSFPWQLIPSHPKPVMFIKIADINVAVYHLKLTSKYTFSSYKLKALHFLDKYQIQKQHTRPGVIEIIENFEQTQTIHSATPSIQSNLNLALAETKNGGLSPQN